MFGQIYFYYLMFHRAFEINFRSFEETNMNVAENDVHSSYAA